MSNHETPVIPATIALLVATLVALTIIYIKTRKIAKMPLFSAILLGIFGFLTVFSGNEIFIKIKPTLVNLLFASILLSGYFLKKPLLKMLLGHSLIMQESAWHQLSLRWAIFFIFLAILNEIMWRHFSTDFWVGFKVFGILPITIMFTLFQIPFILRQQKLHNESSSN
ncbi:MAG: intracellular septation protein [Lentimonas sp.]|jgi:intracellular septation protein